jgi:hypothetical protein
MQRLTNKTEAILSKMIDLVFLRIREVIINLQLHLFLSPLE